nr:MAG TPA: hypothetical protein [Caudoviricetes sp.]
MNLFKFCRLDGLILHLRDTSSWFCNSLIFISIY